MKKLLINEKFYKSVPREKISKVEEICKKIEKQLRNSDNGIYNTYLRNQTKKFHSKTPLLKFRTSDGDRIIFAFIKDLKNCRDKEKLGDIFLIDYVSHDEQSRKARNIITANLKEAKDDKSTVIDMELEEANPEEYKKYEHFFDVSKMTMYLRNEDELSTLFRDDPGLFEICIDDKQYEYAVKRGSCVLIGGAGSGKTLVCLHKLNNLMNYEGTKAYFTYSEMLKTKSAELFRKISGDGGAADFYTIEDFCLKFIEIKESQFIDLFWFKKNFDAIRNSVELPSNIDAVEVWAEIRGIIKGYMRSEWNKSFPIDFTEISGTSRCHLEKRYQYIKSYSLDGRLIICEDTSEKRKNDLIKEILDDDELMEDEREEILHDLGKIYEMSTKFEYLKSKDNLDKRMLPLDEYLGLNNDVSIYSEDERKNIYRICLNYQKKIDEESLYDDNDLAGLAIMKLRELSEKPFSCLVVDELQDLTELQIFLIYNLVENIDNIFLSGDIHQIINPTYFNLGRLKSLFKLNNHELEELLLDKNYRSQKNIVELANRLSKIRVKNIAKQNQESEVLVQAINEGNKLFALKSGYSNLYKMLQAVNERADAAVVVCDNEDKQYLESILGDKGNNIYTISDIKGLEFDYIFCYNMIGKYLNYWNDIFSGKAKKNSKYRYYFNIFYVAITRSKKYLCIYNEENLEPLTANVSDLFDLIEVFDEEKLCLNIGASSLYEWEQRARELENDEKYDIAIEAYKKANSHLNNIQRCKAKKKAREKDYNGAIEIMLQIGEYNYAERYAEAIGQVPMIIISSMLKDDNEYEQLEKRFGRDAVIKALTDNVMNEYYGDKLTSNFIHNYVLNKMYSDIDNVNNVLRILGDR